MTIALSDGVLPEPLYKVSLFAEDGQHRFTINDAPTFLPGVTGILDVLAKHALLPWTAKEVSLYMSKIITRIRHLKGRYKKKERQFLDDVFLEKLVLRAKKQAKFIKESAGKKGSTAHAHFDSLLCEGELPKDGYKEKVLFESFLYWKQNESLKIIKGDTKIASLVHNYGGSLDAIALDDDGKFVIIDFKTGKQIYDSHAYQVASYSYAMKETYGLSYYPRGVVVRLDSEKVKYQRKKIYNIHDSFKGFKSALDAYHIQQLPHFEKVETFDREKISKKAGK